MTFKGYTLKLEPEVGFKFGRGYVPLDQGHCVHPRLKDRTADTPACARYRCGEKSRQEF